MSIQRVALIFDHHARPDTTGVYCRSALGHLVDVEHFLPTDLSRIPRQGFDLYLHIDDGLRYRLPADLRPCAFWAIDTHLDLPWYLSKAPDFDCVFTAQRDGAEQLRAAGITAAAWLPLACDLTTHRKHDVSKQYDVSFVGNLFPGPRSELVELIRRRFPSHFVGQRYFDEMAETYSASRIVFNRSLQDDINMRVFEALACGSMLLTNDLRENGQEELFQDGVYLATYRDAEELADKIAYYLKHEELRERIAAAGRQEVAARHIYRHRMERLLREVEAERSRTIVGGSSVLASYPRQDLHSETRPPGHSGDCEQVEDSWQSVLERVPLTARNVLDIGCGTGLLGEALRARQSACVIGVEWDEEAAHVAHDRLDDLFGGDIEHADIQFPNDCCDTVICDGSLGRVRNPLRLLHRVHEWLEPGGRLVASFLNVRNHTLFRSVMDGNWAYGSSPLLNDDCLRLFTRREIEKLLYRAGFAVRELRAIPGPGHAEWLESGRLTEVRAGRLHISGFTQEDAQEFYVGRFVVVAEPVKTVTSASHRL